MRNSLFIIMLLLLVACIAEKKPVELAYFQNYREGISYAQKQNQLILLIFDFWANPTMSTLKLIEDDEIIRLLKNYTVIHLMVDDRTMLDSGKTLGEFNHDLQVSMGLKNQPCCNIRLKSKYN